MVLPVSCISGLRKKIDAERRKSGDFGIFKRSLALRESEMPEISLTGRAARVLCFSHGNAAADYGSSSARFTKLSMKYLLAMGRLFLSRYPAAMVLLTAGTVGPRARR